MASEKKDRPVLAAGAVRDTMLVKFNTTDLKKQIVFDMKYLAETDGWIANQEGDNTTVKRHMDGLMKIKVSGDEQDGNGKIAVAFPIDMSGSMGIECDSELTRIEIALQNVRYFIKNFPVGTIIWVLGFATEVQFLKGLCGVEIPASDEEKDRLCQLVKSISVGAGTAIHDAHETILKEFNDRSKSLVDRGITSLLLACFTDGQDNSSRFPWNAANYKADKGVEFTKSLDHLYKNYIAPINKKGIKVELAFHGISSGADWNILRKLNDYPKFNSSGRVIENDGGSLSKGFKTYINNFMKTASTNNQMTFTLDTVSEKAGVQIRILDPSEGLVPGANDYGSRVITSPWHETSDFRMLGDFSRGKEYSVMFQLLFDMQRAENGKYHLQGFPEKFPEVTVTAELTGDRVPGMISGMLTTMRIKIPIIWDTTITKFNQVQSKWQVRLEKHWIAMRSMMTKLFDMVGQNSHKPIDTKVVFEMIDDEINAIKKDQDQCYRDAAHEEDSKSHDELRQVSPFYDPPEMNPEVACFTRMIEDLRIMKAYLKHPALQVEARAKIFEFLLPERRGASVTTVFNSLFLSDEQFTGAYKQLIGREIGDDTKLVFGPGSPADEFNLKLMNKFALVAKQSFKDQQLRKDREYNRDTLVTFANAFLASGITHEELQKSVQATTQNRNMARARYIKRG